MDMSKSSTWVDPGIEFTVGVCYWGFKIEVEIGEGVEVWDRDRIGEVNP